MLTCIKEIDGFTVGKTYYILERNTEYLTMEDDNKQLTVIHESYFVSCVYTM